MPLVKSSSLRLFTPSLVSCATLAQGRKRQSERGRGRNRKFLWAPATPSLVTGRMSFCWTQSYLTDACSTLVPRRSLCFATLTVPIVFFAGSEVVSLKNPECESKVLSVLGVSDVCVPGAVPKFRSSSELGRIWFLCREVGAIFSAE